MPHSVPGLMSPGMMPPTGMVGNTLSLLLRLWFTVSGYFSISPFLHLYHTHTHTHTHTDKHAHRHTLTHTHTQPPRYQWPPRSLSSKWQPVQSDTCTQPPDTSRSLVYQKQILCSTPRKPTGGWGGWRINWSGDLFSQIIPVDVAFCRECILISAIKSTPLVYVHRQWWC